MAVQYILTTTDVKGFKMPFKRFDNYDHTFWSFLPDDIDEHLLGIRESEVRNDDVFLCTYPRSGTNWTNEIVRMLTNGNSNYISKDNFMNWFDVLSMDEKVNMKSLRVFVTHLPFQFLPRQLSQKGKVICVFRNPKDVAVSYFNYTRDINFAEFDGSFDDYLKLFYNGDVPSGSWFQYVQDWENIIENKSVKTLLQIYYEDMIKSHGHALTGDRIIVQSDILQDWLSKDPKLREAKVFQILWNLGELCKTFR